MCVGSRRSNPEHALGQQASRLDSAASLTLPAAASGMVGRASPAISLSVRAVRLGEWRARDPTELQQVHARSHSGKNKPAALVNRSMIFFSSAAAVVRQRSETISAIGTSLCAAPLLPLDDSPFSPA